MRAAVNVAYMKKTRDAYKVLVREPLGKGEVGRPHRRLQYNIIRKINLRKISCSETEADSRSASQEVPRLFMQPEGSLPSSQDPANSEALFSIS